MRRAQRWFVLLGLSGCTLIGETGGWLCASDDECPTLYRCRVANDASGGLCEAAPRPVAAPSPVTDPNAGPPDAGPRSADAGQADAGTGPRFKADVQPILDQHCAACHGENPLGNQVKLTAAESYVALVGADSTCAPGMKSVTPGDLMASMLWRKLGGSTSYCGSPMPTTGSLKATQPAAFAIIEAWIRQGAKND
jgi:hypothetical protein